MSKVVEMNLLVLICVVAVCNAASTDDLRISTTSGVLKGKLGVTLGQKVRLFLGVPYAQAPLGSLRFRPPVALEKRAQLNATHFRPSCLQPPHLSSVVSPLLHPNQVEFSEDCLFLNIYVPPVQGTTSKLPVIVFLAGEGFNYADPSQFDGSYLAVQGNVVFVTVNYRVSVFGFLSGLTDSAPGNVGLYDQRLALKWINENIEKFGGDPNRVTLSGRFTGAMSAAIHAFSPLSQKEQLFQRVILQNGVPVGDWVFDRNPLNATISLAEKKQCLYMNLTETIDCLREIPAQELLESSLEIPQSWRPIFDFKLINSDSFKEAARSSHAAVDILFGMNNNEGTLCTIGLKAAQSPLYDKIVSNTITETDFEELINGSMNFMYKKTDVVLNKLAIHKYKYMSSNLRDNFVQFCGDIFVTSNLEKLADTVSNHQQNVFVYQLSHRASFSIHPPFIAAAHGDDVLFTTGLPLQLQDLPEHEVLLTKQMVAAVSNFAYYGNPNGNDSTGSWPLFTKSKRSMMDFRADEPSTAIRSPYQDAMDFFYDILPTVANSECTLSSLPIAQALSQHPRSDSKQAHTQGKPLTEGVMLGLLCAVMILFVITMAVIIKVKKYSGFQRV